MMPAWLCLCALTLAGLGDDGSAPARFRDRVDAEIDRGIAGTAAAPADDAEFLRRVFLDLAGRIPSESDALAFLGDPSPDKREALVDRLLAAPEFARRLAVAFDVMLMERRPAKNVSAEEWQKFLRDAFAANRPVDAILRDVLAADGADPSRRGAARFLLDRDADPDLLTRDVGRLFLGRDMRCNQCHDHILYDDYKQSHYFGLFAFFSRSYLATDAAKVVTLGEKADGDVTFKSVFKRKVTNATGPRILDDAPIAEPDAAKTAGYLIPPADGARAVPKFSRRARLAESVATARQPAFTRNVANRLWALVMGRGLVQPLDLHTIDNPPSHPELLDALAEELVSRNFDARGFLRELMMTRAYARSSEPPPGMSPVDMAADRFAVAPLEPLHPEAMAWSVMQACGIVDATRQDVERRMTVADPRMRQILELDDTRRAMGRMLAEDQVYQALRGNEAAFVSQFGRAAGQSQDAHDATVHQALFLANGDPMNAWIAGLANRLAAIGDASSVADSLYLSILSRRPSPEERDEVAALLAANPATRVASVHAMAWAMFTSAEFRFNH